MKGKHLNTRVSPEAYQALLRKCADGNCSPYQYLKKLIEADVGIGVDEDALVEPREKTLMDLIKDE